MTTAAVTPTDGVSVTVGVELGRTVLVGSEVADGVPVGGAVGEAVRVLQERAGPSP
jgi:hypothetical protein